MVMVGWEEGRKERKKEYGMEVKQKKDGERMKGRVGRRKRNCEIDGRQKWGRRSKFNVERCGGKLGYRQISQC
jgi:hypothetical protein